MSDSPPVRDPSDLSERVRALMPQLTDEPSELVAIPSVSEAGYPEHTHAEPFVW